MKTLLKKVKDTALQPARKRVVKPMHKAPKKGNAQIFKYRVMWDNIFRKFGWLGKSDAEKEDLRHSINEDLFGSYTRPSLLSNSQWDVMYFALDTLFAEGELVWNDGLAAYAREEGWRRVYTKCILTAGADCKDVEFAGAPNAYIASISLDVFATENWRALDSESLKHLFWTIKSRVRNAAKSGTSLYAKPQPSGVPAAAESTDDDFFF